MFAEFGLITNLKSQTSNLKSIKLFAEFGLITNLKSQISNLKSQITNLKPQISNLKPNYRLSFHSPHIEHNALELRVEARSAEEE